MDYITQPYSTEEVNIWVRIPGGEDHWEPCWRLATTLRSFCLVATIPLGFSTFCFKEEEEEREQTSPSQKWEAFMDQEKKRCTWLPLTLHG